nr:hypothetical protein [Tanacetum cinerariifolium]
MPPRKKTCLTTPTLEIGESSAAGAARQPGPTESDLRRCRVEQEGPEHPPSPDYVPGPEHPPSPIEIPYAPEPEYPEYLAPSDDETLTQRRIQKKTEDDQADYPADGGDGDDEPSDDENDDDDINDKDPEEEPFEEDDEEEEEEHSTLVDSPPVPIVDLACIARLAALLSPPLLVPSLPLPLPSPLTTRPTDTRAPLGYRAAGIRMRALLPSTSHRTDILEADMPPRKKAFLTTPILEFEIEESSVAGAARQLGPTESDLRRCRVEQA